MSGTSALSGATDVFALSGSGRCVAFFTARRRAALPKDRARRAAAGVAAELERLADDGWILSVGGMFGRSEPPTAFATGFAQDADIVGAFEAPDRAAALAGTARLGAAGWDELLRTAWLLGPREFAPVPRPEDGSDPPAWGFFALWQWNAAWQAATPQERAEYDAECDVAFASDVASGIGIAGRHRLDAAGRWHHLGIWECPGFPVIDAAMREHERVADFKFTTSRHYAGRRTPLLDLLEPADG
ncbi:hypothetical protein [Streptomyces tremellae]|uniref:DUF3291 domain-containing protein n=1 Tax=Streptomyces tremellae TaxID=1124239 RepID=A0ABP7FHD2_9ACTN